MKRVFKCLLILFIVFTCVFLIDNVKAVDTSIYPGNPSISNITFEEAKNMVKEVLSAYYFKGPYFQYNYAKTIYPDQFEDYGEVITPEEATSQDMKYLVCAAYVDDVYHEAFGITANKVKDEDNNYMLYYFPIFNSSQLAAASYYYNSTDRENYPLDGNFLIYYENKSDEKKYIYGKTGTVSISDFAKMIQPGDVFTYTGHVMVAYDKFQKEDGTWDVLLLNSHRSSQIKTPINGSTTPLYYDKFSAISGATEIDVINRNQTLYKPAIAKEGTVKYKLLSEVGTFESNGNLSCSSNHECTVLRPYFNSNGNAAFNYTIQDESVNKTRLRTDEFPGITIEKINSAGDNNSVYLGDTIRYSVEITNNSGNKGNAQKYTNINIKERISNKYLEFISTNSNGLYDTETNTITWNIEDLKAGETEILYYDVKVKEDYSNVGKTIKNSSGKIYSSNEDIYISTGTVKNKIVPKVTNYISNYATCYSEALSSKKGLALVDYVINCATGKNLNLNNFNFDEIIVRNPEKDYTSGLAISRNTVSNSDYLKMILNNYWSGTSIFCSKTDKETNKCLEYRIDLSRFSNAAIRLTRNRTINARDFKDGDVLIYSQDHESCENYGAVCTNENGLYAYVYINGEFVGKNGSGDTARNAFTYNYYTENPAYNTNLSNMFYKFYETLESQPLEAVFNEDRTFINYQTLFGKDNYVILRPEMVIKEVVKLELTKTSYIQNYDSLISEDANLNITYNNGEVETIRLNSQGVTVTGFDNTTLGTKTITVSYEGFETTFDVEIVAPSISGIEMHTLPTKTSYIYGQETLDLTGGKIQVNYNNNTNEVIDLTSEGVTVTGFDNTSAGTKTLTVTYEGFETTFEVTITKVLIGIPEVSIDTNGIVTWSNVEGASSYEVSFDNVTYEPGISGEVTIPLTNAGEVTVYVKGVPDENHISSDNSYGLASVNVYSLTITKDEGIDTVSGTGNYVSGKTVTIAATLNEGYTFTGWLFNGDEPDNINSLTTTVTLTQNTSVGATSTVVIEEPVFHLPNMTIDAENYVLNNIDSQTSLSELFNTTEYNNIIEIYSKDGILLYSSDTTSNVYISTGQYLTYLNQNNERVTYKIVVPGDTDGNGKISYMDYVKVYNHIQKSKHPELTNKSLLVGEYLIAGDMSGDERINYMDYVKIYNKIKELKGN